MKSLFLGLIISSSVFAGDPDIFTGKYEALLDEQCELTMYANEGSSRTYVYLKRNKYHNNLLSLNFDVYGEGATGEVFVIENGKYQTVGTSAVDIVSDTVKSKWINPNKIVVEIRTQKPSRNLDYTKVYELTLNKKQLNLKTYIINQPGQDESTCDFIKK